PAAAGLPRPAKGRCRGVRGDARPPVSDRLGLRGRARGGGPQPRRRAAGRARYLRARCYRHSSPAHQPWAIMTYTTIKLERDGVLAILTLNRPEKMNSLSDQLLADFRAAMDECEHDQGVRAMIVTGSGKAFSAGFDISPREKPRTSVQD